LGEYLSGYKDCFKSKTRSGFGIAVHYTKGLFKCEKKKGTCTGMAAKMQGPNNQSLNHLISDGAWSYQAAMDRIATKTNSFFGKLFTDIEDACLIIDEVGVPKKGKRSACVGRQWLGCLGKQDNGQVSVGLIACCRHYYSMVNLRLFMPESWEKDKKRREEAGIPEDIAHQTKPEIALEMIKKAIGEGFKFSWVGFDALYGMDFGLLRTLDTLQVTFMGEVRKNTRIFLERPSLRVPTKKPGSRGREPKNLKPDKECTNVDKYAKSLDKDDWSLVTFREGTRRKMQAWFHKRKIWTWDEGKDYSQCYTLLIRKDTEGIKYSLTNADEKTPLVRLAYMQGERYFVEKSFKECKNQVGMGDYQVRSWDGFHRHMALCMIALNFMMEQKKELKRDLPYVTAEDIRQIIAFIVPDKHLTVESLFKDIVTKHEVYRKQIERARNKPAPLLAKVVL
jgi:SRSO17 transposase